MATFLFDKIVFGPVYSRRLGISLGINLMPEGRKICNFDCVYCECGATHSSRLKGVALPSREQVRSALYNVLEEMAAGDQDPDVITFAGNGEPTLHPDFPAIIDDTIEVKNIFFPEAEIAVLSNSTTIHRPEIAEAMRKIDKCILKLDSARTETIINHNRPKVKIDAPDLIDTLASLDFDIIIQTMFIRGSYEGGFIDNTTDEEVREWIRALEKIRPSMVQIYTISRDAPEGNHIEKVEEERLEEIALLVREAGFDTQVSA